MADWRGLSVFETFPVNYPQIVDQILNLCKNEMILYLQNDVCEMEEETVEKKTPCMFCFYYMTQFSGSSPLVL